MIFVRSAGTPWVYRAGDMETLVLELQAQMEDPANNDILATYEVIEVQVQRRAVLRREVSAIVEVTPVEVSA